VSGTTELAPPAGVRLVRVVTAQQMLEAVNARVAEIDIFVGVAAVADYHVANRQEHKIKKDSTAALRLELAPNPDILEAVAGRRNPPFCVGFAAESQDLERHAEEKRRRKNVPLMAANLVQSALGTEDNELVLIDDSGLHRLTRSTKLDQARALVRHVARLYRPSRAAVSAS
jgi:phosphopantothenoylcysteine decarboxylase/phosphopantothenate--cysteine ligase